MLGSSASSTPKNAFDRLHLSGILSSEIPAVSPKVLYCTRTHSQAFQVLSEFKKTAFFKLYNACILGSRRALCINKAINGSAQAIDDSCIELLSTSSKCPYYNHDKSPDMASFLGAMVKDIKSYDLDEFKGAASQRNCCPYYGVRHLAPACHLIIMPYNYILSKSMRESTGFDLASCIVIFDEAHNIPRSILEINSVELVDVCSKLRRILGFLGQNPLTARRSGALLSTLFLRQATEVFANISACITCISSKIASSKLVLTINEFVSQSKLSNLNIMMFADRLSESKILHAIMHSSRSQKDDDGDEGSLQLIIEFLRLCANAEPSGRIVLTSRSPDRIDLKFLLLDMSSTFSSVVSTAYSVVFSGGTLSPVYNS